MAVAYENLIGKGAFTQSENIETVTVPASATIARGTVLGKITATGKYVTSLNASVDGSEVAVAVLQNEIVNDTAGAVDVAEVVFKSGTFNSTGLTFGTGQTVANTVDDLHNVSIEIITGV